MNSLRKVKKQPWQNVKIENKTVNKMYKQTVHASTHAQRAKQQNTKFFQMVSLDKFKRINRSRFFTTVSIIQEIYFLLTCGIETDSIIND